MSRRVPQPALRRRLSGMVGRLRASAPSIAQAAVAATGAYFLAVFLLGHERPFFAPIAAVVALSVTLGSRGRRAVELVFGVAIGLVVADLLVLLIGTGAFQIGAVVALAMGAAALVGGGPLLVNQAAISALLVVVLEPPEGAFAFDRFFDALVGGGVALAVNYPFAVDPERLVARAARPVFEELAAVLEEISTSLEGADLGRTEGALEGGRALDARIGSFNEVLAAGRSPARLSPTRHRSLAHLGLYEAAGARIDLIVANGRGLARGAANAVRRGGPVPEPIPQAVRDLARAVTALADYLEGTTEPDEARRHALEAAAKATRVLDGPHNLTTSVLVGQVRTAAVDVLRSTGMDGESAVGALEEAAGRATEIG